MRFKIQKLKPAVVGVAGNFLDFRNVSLASNERDTGIRKGRAYDANDAEIDGAVRQSIPGGFNDGDVHFVKM